MNNDLGVILLAEDSRNDVELTLEAFAESNLANRVVVVPDGAEALDFLRRHGRFEARESIDPVVVLLDIKMPKIDGLEVLCQMKADPQLRLIPVVMMSSSREEPDLQESYRLGANAYVVKPIDFREFVSAVKVVGKFWAVVNAPPRNGSELR
jgi:CheY-like chemotaxis protein